MKEFLISAHAKDRRRRILCVFAAALCWLTLSATPGKAQFDFLGKFFGKPSPPPAEPQAAEPGKTPEHKESKNAKHKPKKAEAPKSAPDAKANTPVPEAPPAPYDAELLRVAEILGALTYLDDLCKPNPSGDWRGKMQALLEADAKTQAVKDRLAGSYNRGFRDYERTYHFCTQNAQLVISRFIAEGGKIAHDVVNRYGSS